MTPFTVSPVFSDNIGQMLSSEDLSLLRGNALYAEMLSYRTMPGFASSGSVDTRTPNYYPNDGTYPLGFGNLQFRTGMTTLTVTGTSANPGSMTFQVLVDGNLRITISPVANWSGTWTFAGYADGQVMEIQIQAVYSAGGAPANASFVITSVYGSPISFGLAWPGTPTFTTAWTAALLNQLCDAASWVYNRAAATPIRPDLSILYGLGPYSGNNQPLYYATVGRHFSNSQFAFSGQVANDSSPGLVLQIYFDGVLVYTGPNLAIGTTDIFFTLSLAAYSVGQLITVAVFLNNTTAAVRTSWSYCRYIIRACRSQVDTSAIYASIPATPADGIAVSVATVAAYLNSLSSTVLAAYNRIQATPAVFNRSWAVRRFFSKFNNFSDTGQVRGRPRFIRNGHRLTVRGKGLSIAWGPISVPTNVRGLEFDDYTMLNNQAITGGDTIQTQTIYLDTLPGLAYGIPYFVLGDASWVHESVI